MRAQKFVRISRKTSDTNSPSNMYLAKLFGYKRVSIESVETRTSNKNSILLAIGIVSTDHGRSRICR